MGPLSANLAGNVFDPRTIELLPGGLADAPSEAMALAHAEFALVDVTGGAECHGPPAVRDDGHDQAVGDVQMLLHPVDAGVAIGRRRRRQRHLATVPVAVGVVNFPRGGDDNRIACATGGQ